MEINARYNQALTRPEITACLAGAWGPRESPAPLSRPFHDTMNLGRNLTVVCVRERSKHTLDVVHHVFVDATIDAMFPIDGCHAGEGNLRHPADVLLPERR